MPGVRVCTASARLSRNPSAVRSVRTGSSTSAPPDDITNGRPASHSMVAGAPSTSTPVMRPPLPKPRSAVMVNGAGTWRGSSTAPCRCTAVTVPLICVAPVVTPDTLAASVVVVLELDPGPAITWSALLPPGSKAPLRTP